MILYWAVWIFGCLLIITFLASIIVFCGAREWEWRRTYDNACMKKLTGKTVLVTGGNAGIGKHTALDLARRGARVIIACRNHQKADVAVAEIRRLSGNESVYFRHLDLSSFASIRKFSEGFLHEESRLDILINNAGIALGRPGETTKEGHDILFGTNHFGPFLLTLLLLDRLKASGSISRVVNVSSLAHWYAHGFDMTPKRTSQGRILYPELRGYACSKLANILFTRELHHRCKGTNVTTYSVSPGGVYTSIWHTSLSTRSWTRFLYHFIDPLLWLLMQSEKEGAQTTIYCAVEETITHLSGRYFRNCHVTSKESTLAKDDGIARKLWEISCEVTQVDTKKF